MQNASHPLAASAVYSAIMAAPLAHLERHFGVRRLKRGMLVMLGAWLGYFVVVSMWLRALNKVTVPVLDMPLGVVLVINGSALIFVAALVLLLRTAAQTRH
jgi:hypothetical protein